MNMCSKNLRAIKSSEPRSEADAKLAPVGAPEAAGTGGVAR
jgi:hypothetical protein